MTTANKNNATIAAVLILLYLWLRPKTQTGVKIFVDDPRYPAIDGHPVTGNDFGVFRETWPPLAMY